MTASLSPRDLTIFEVTKKMAAVTADQWATPEQRTYGVGGPYPAIMAITPPDPSTLPPALSDEVLDVLREMVKALEWSRRRLVTDGYLVFTHVDAAINHADVILGEK